METLILSWYVLTETGSVIMLTLFASLQYIGTLFAPVFGMIGHRIGNKKLLCAMRSIYAGLAILLLVPALTGALQPLHVFLYAAAIGVVRPSDAVMRFALIGETVPSRSLMTAMGIQRTTNDSARLAGYLAGAGIFALLGIAMTVLGIACLYIFSLLLTFAVANSPVGPQAPANTTAAAPSPWGDLKDSISYVATTPALLAVMCMALLVNMTAFPLINGLLPVVAKDVYGTDQTGLGYLAASFAFGALAGSIALSKFGEAIRAGRTMMLSCIVWYALMIVFAQVPGLTGGIVMLTMIGFAQSLCMVPMSALILRIASERFRSRVLGLRVLAVYGVPIGLLCSGPLISGFGYPVVVMLYSLMGLIFTLLILMRWRRQLWIAGEQV